MLDSTRALAKTPAAHQLLTPTERLQTDGGFNRSMQHNNAM
jgi:hypothetical protein